MSLMCHQCSLWPPCGYARRAGHSVLPLVFIDLPFSPPNLRGRSVDGRDSSSSSSSSSSRALVSTYKQQTLLLDNSHENSANEQHVYKSFLKRSCVCAWRIVSGSHFQAAGPACMRERTLAKLGLQSRSYIVRGSSRS